MSYSMLSVLVLLPIIGMVLLLVGVIVVTAMVRGEGKCGRAGRGNQADETRMMQELNHGFADLERRIEALETLLLDKAGKDE